MIKKILSLKTFWFSVIIFALAFIILFNLVRIIFEFNFNFGEYFAFYFNEKRLSSFIVANLIGGFIYGFLTAYYRFWKHFKVKK